MKWLYFLLSLVITSTLLYAQDSSIVLSNYEIYCTSQGKLLKTFSILMGEVHSARIEVLKTTDLRKGDTVSVVSISSAYLNYTPIIANENLYFEKEQLDTVINILKYLTAEIKNQNVSHFIYSYITRNDIQINCGGSAWVSFAKVYQHLRTPVSPGFSFGKKDIDVLIQLFQSAQKLL